MPVEVAAVRGERFDGKGAAKAGYQEARSTVTLGKGKSKEVRIPCALQPERVVVDPDARVLQLRRNAATVKVTG